MFNLADFDNETKNNDDDEDDNDGCVDDSESTGHNNLQIVRESRALLQVHSDAAAADSMSTSEAVPQLVRLLLACRWPDGTMAWKFPSSVST